MSTAVQRHKRYPVTLFIGNAEDSVPLGRSRNISVSGVFVETMKRPDIGTEHEIWFVWGEEIYTTIARVVRHADDGVGIEFVEPEPILLRAIREIVGEETDY